MLPVRRFVKVVMRYQSSAVFSRVACDSGADVVHRSSSTVRHVADGSWKRTVTFVRLGAVGNVGLAESYDERNLETG